MCVLFALSISWKKFSKLCKFQVSVAESKECASVSVAYIKHTFRQKKQQNTQNNNKTCKNQTVTFFLSKSCQNIHPSIFYTCTILSESPFST